MSDISTPKDRAQLYRKIAAVTAAVSRIPKNGENTFYRYKYATESDITDGLRDLLEQHGLAFLPPSVISWERSETTKKDGNRGDDLTRVQLQFGLACADTGEVFTAMFWGEGQDGGDKGFYKAYTGAVKYFLMKTFLIATGDDPEQDQRPPAAAPERRAARSQEPPANGKKPPSREGLVARIGELVAEAKELGITINDESTVAGRTDAELIEAGKKLAATIAATKRKAAMQEEADLPT